MIFISESSAKTSKWTITETYDLYKKSGIRGIISGVVPRVLKIAPACAIMTATYECGKRFFQDRNKEMLFSKKE